MTSHREATFREQAKQKGAVLKDIVVDLGDGRVIQVLMTLPSSFNLKPDDRKNQIFATTIVAEVGSNEIQGNANTRGPGFLAMILLNDKFMGGSVVTSDGFWRLPIPNTLKINDEIKIAIVGATSVSPHSVTATQKVKKSEEKEKEKEKEENDDDLNPNDAISLSPSFSSASNNDMIMLTSSTFEGHHTTASTTISRKENMKKLVIPVVEQVLASVTTGVVKNWNECRNRTIVASVLQNVVKHIARRFDYYCSMNELNEEAELEQSKFRRNNPHFSSRAPRPPQPTTTRPKSAPRRKKAVNANTKIESTFVPVAPSRPVERQSHISVFLRHRTIVHKQSHPTEENLNQPRHTMPEIKKLPLERIASSPRSRLSPTVQSARQERPKSYPSPLHSPFPTERSRATTAKPPNGYVPKSFFASPYFEQAAARVPTVSNAYQQIPLFGNPKNNPIVHNSVGAWKKLQEREVVLRQRQIQYEERLLSWKMDQIADELKMYDEISRATAASSSQSSVRFNLNEINQVEKQPQQLPHLCHRHAAEAPLAGSSNRVCLCCIARSTAGKPTPIHDLYHTSKS